MSIPCDPIGKALDSSPRGREFDPCLGCLVSRRGPVSGSHPFCFQKLVSGELHSLYWGGFPNQCFNPVPWSQAPNRQQHMDSLRRPQSSPIGGDMNNLWEYHPYLSYHIHIIRRSRYIIFLQFLSDFNEIWHEGCTKSWLLGKPRC